ncbi:MAG: hypothetical protein QNK89_00960 [Lacinutrix sp.]
MTIFGAIMIASLILTSCGGNDKKNNDYESDGDESSEYIEDTSYSNDENESNEDVSSEFSDVSDDDIEDTQSSSSSNECEDFLKDYEKFMDKYIAILKKMKNNPSDMSVLSNYTSMMTEATEWADKTADCAADAKFAAKLSAIQMKIANAAAEM